MCGGCFCMFWCMKVTCFDFYVHECSLRVIVSWCRTNVVLLFVLCVLCCVNVRDISVCVVCRCITGVFCYIWHEWFMSSCCCCCVDNRRLEHLSSSIISLSFHSLWLIFSLLSLSLSLPPQVWTPRLRVITARKTGHVYSCCFSFTPLSLSLRVHLFLLVSGLSSISCEECEKRRQELHSLLRVCFTTVNGGVS